MTVLTGTISRLRPIQRNDLAASLRWRNDPEIRDLVMGYRFPVTEVMESAWYDRILADQGGKRASFAVEDLFDDAFVGFLHLYDIDWITRTAELGIVIGEPSRQRKGLGHETIGMATVYAFNTLNLERISVRFLSANKGSRRVFESLGFVEEGRMRSAGRLQGRSEDVIIMGLLKRELRFAPPSAESGAG